MFHTQKEILSQFESIQKTTEYIWLRKNKIESVFDGTKHVVFVGSGSSYSIAKSAAAILNLRGSGNALAIAAGDLLLNFKNYEKYIGESVLVSLSRSGNTSELLLSMEKAVNELGCTGVSICAQENAQIEQHCRLNLVLPWAFDQSVCQTRTVSNLYIASSLLVSIIAGDAALSHELLNATRYAAEFQQRYEKLFESIGNLGWSHAVVLADCEVAGCAEEGALALREISRVNSNHYHVMDVRHGPIVVIDKKALVVLVAEKSGGYLVDLVKDLKNKGAYVLSMTMDETELGADQHITLPKFENMIAAALYMLFSIQMIALNKALAQGMNPDQPDGLDPCVFLAEM